jgi:hypothetical protein
MDAVFDGLDPASVPEPIPAISWSDIPAMLLDALGDEWAAGCPPVAVEVAQPPASSVTLTRLISSAGVFIGAP